MKGLLVKDYLMLSAQKRFMLLALIAVAGVLWLLSQLLGFPLTN